MSFETIGRLRGHKDSVCCIAVPENLSTLFTSGEDGAICAFDLRRNKLAARLQVGENDAAVPSLVMDPSSNDRLYCCSGSDVLLVDTRKGEGAGCVWRHKVNSEEANAVAVSADGRLLASADDSGQVAVLDTDTRSLVRVLRDGHTSIASSIAFQGRNSWQLVSGGLDCQLILWNVSTGKPLQRWRMGAEEGSQEATQVYNPPMIHALACGRSAEGNVLEGVVATARGDGIVAAYDTLASASTAVRQRKSLSRQAKSACSSHIFARRSHTAAVSCISCPATSTGQVVLSGGNDGRLVFQGWGNTLPDMNAEVQEGFPVAECLHGRKVNDIAASTSLPLDIYVADVSKTVSMYRIR